MPEISIVTPSFNQARFIEDCLRSVKEQNYPSIEHIVVDGGSTDATVELLKKYSALPGWEHLRWISEPDQGQSDALNKGFRMARGNLIGWLNADDTYLPGCFEQISRYSHNYATVDIFYGDYAWISENGMITQTRREIMFRKFILFYSRVNFIHSSGALFLKRRIFDDGYFLNDKLHYSMDFEFYLRAAIGGYRFRHIPQVLSLFRWHPECKSSKHLRRQVQEMEQARLCYEPLSKHVSNRKLRQLVLYVLIGAATAMRWSEKAIRGYYFTQFRPRRLRELGVTMHENDGQLRHESQ